MADYRLSYPKGSIGKARAFRSGMTDAEKRLWSILRRNQFGVHFRRQVPVGSFFCDFACLSAKLAIEANGGQHVSKAGMKHDAERDRFLRSRGFTVLRFPNKEILTNTDGVIRKIAEYIHGNE